MKSPRLLLLLFLVHFSCSKKTVPNTGCINNNPNQELSSDSFFNETLGADAYSTEGKDSLTLKKRYSNLQFPLRIIELIDEGMAVEIREKETSEILEILNSAFEPVEIRFDLERKVEIESELSLQDFTKDEFKEYRAFNKKYLEENLIYLVLVDRHEICEFKRDNKGEILSVSCSKPSGFAKILEHDHNAIFIAKQDYNHRKILPHEFGHFFGLFHTHEKVFGEDDINNTHQSQTMGDLISDTPVDPGINGYVNYSSCRYDDFIQPSTGMKYQPMIENYMSYYEPCYMREYKFTPEQVRRMSTAASGPYRFHLAKQRGI